jgi:hypothetical protein
MARGIAGRSFRAGEFLFKLLDSILQVIIEREIDTRSPRADFSPHQVKRRANALNPQLHRPFLAPLTPRCPASAPPEMRAGGIAKLLPLFGR